MAVDARVDSARSEEKAVNQDVSEFLEPLDTLRLQARATPAIRQDDEWRLQLTAAIAAARACGVKSDVLADYEALLTT